MKNTITRRFLPGLLLGMSLISVAAEPANKPSANPAQSAKEQYDLKPATKQSFQTLEWDDLLPEEDLQALLNPPEYLSSIEDGSSEDQLVSGLQNNIPNGPMDRFQQALISTEIIQELDGKAAKIPGFIVPLEFDDDQVITEFFLVPYFGACIHVPPPPPNQIIYIKYKQGFKLESLYDPFWISGTLETTLVKNDMATSAYSMTASKIEPYTEE